MKQFSSTWYVTKEQEGMLLRDFLTKEHNISRRLLTDIKFHGGQIEVNGRHVTVRHQLRAGDDVTISFPKEERSASMKPYSLPLDIVYEDEHVLVINKPTGLATIPSRQEPNISLAQGILAYYDLHQIPATIHIVTRLDRDTSGLVLVAKHRYAHSLLSKQQVAKRIERYYVAVVDGLLHERQGTITLPIARKASSIIERTVDNHGQEAITHFETIGQSEKHTLVKIKLETGRTHQIRVHFSAIGHPLAGDDLYGGNIEHISRQALHCTTLSFQHPFSKEVITLTSEFPPDMRSIIECMEFFGKKRLF